MVINNKHHNGDFKMFTAHKINLDSTLSHKEHLNNDELSEWMYSVYGKFASVRVQQDLTGVVIEYTDNGSEFEIVRKFNV